MMNTIEVNGTYFDRLELSDLWRTARLALDCPNRYQRLCWATDQYAKAHPDVPKIRIYKAVERAIEHPIIS
jgi:hypothetical protein